MDPYKAMFFVFVGVYAVLIFNLILDGGRHGHRT